MSDIDNTVSNSQVQKIDMQSQFNQMHTLSRQQIDVSWQTRLNRLQQLEKMVLDNQDAIATAINKDFGYRSASETMMLEIFPTLEGLGHSKKNGKDWLQPQKVATGKWFLPATSYIKPQPLGVIGIIAPWNYPLYLTIGPLTAAFVAGNRAMLKVSEDVPNFTHWLSQTLPKYFSTDEVCLIEGGLEVSQTFSSLPFDHLFFTGSTSVGRHIMRAAATNLTPVTLELGGKSPVVITDRGCLEKAVNRIWTGKLMNAGQTCIAPDYVLLPYGMTDDFIQLSRQWLLKHYPDISNNPDYSCLINERQFTRVSGYIAEAQENDANMVVLCDAKANLENRFMPPTIVTNLLTDSKLLTEEIFAPILPIITYQKLNEAIDYVNAHPRPLALYIFGNDDNVNKLVLDNTVSGGVTINDTIFHIAQHELPFGGVGASGMGSYHGKHGFDTFSHQKAVFKQAKINFASLLQPPYGKTFDRLMQVAKKW